MIWSTGARLFSLVLLGMAACGDSGSGAEGGSTEGTEGTETSNSEGTGPTSTSDSDSDSGSGGGTSTGPTSGSSGGGTDTGGDVDCTLPPDGNLSGVWAFTLDSGSGTEDAAGPLAMTAANGIVVAGLFGTDTLDPTVWLRKLGPSGDEVWVTSAMSPAQTGLNALAVATAGQFTLVGSTLVQDPMFGLTSRLFASAYDDTGQLLWSDDTPTDPPNPFAQGWSVAMAPDGDVVVGGPAGAGGGYLRRYAPSGSEDWTVATPSGASGLAIDDAGALYVATVDGTEPRVERRDDVGAVVWSEAGPGVGEQDFFEGSAAAVSLGSDGRPVFIGLAQYLVGNPMMPTDSWTKLWVQRRDAAGAEVWTSTFDHTDYAQMSLVVHGDDAVSVVNRRMNDRPLVRRLDASGTLQWDQELPCPLGWRAALVEDDLVLSGSIETATRGKDAYVARLAG